MIRINAKAIIGTAVLALAPVVPALSGSGGGVEAAVRTSVQIGFASPVGVFGFSYDNPHSVGHVHASPIACAHGPLYFYPTYGVYGHFVPGFRYVSYRAPRYYGYGHPYATRYVGEYRYSSRPVVQHHHRGHGGHGKKYHAHKISGSHKAQKGHKGHDRSDRDRRGNGGNRVCGWGLELARIR